MRGTTEAYIAYRRLIGAIGILLPFILLMGAGLRQSLSAYYYTNMEDIFSGALIIIGVFLIIYSIYSIWDNVVTTIAGASAILAALFPAENDNLKWVSFLKISPELSGILHMIFSALLFILIAVMSLFLFTKTSGFMTTKKKIRNLIYRISGIIILLLLVALGIMNGFKLDWGDFTYYSETVMLLAFGISWFIKGETLFRDER